MQRINPRSDSYEALMWDVITNAHRYIPKPGEHVLDLGAHFGMFSLYCAARGCEVDAYEPSEAAFKELCHTAEVATEIGLGHINPVQRAIWSKPGAGLLFKTGESTAANSMIQGSSNDVQKVDTCTLDDALSMRGHWDCVKMDIEGAEYLALTTAQQLARINFLTVEIHHGPLSSEQCRDLDVFLFTNFLTVSRLPVKKNPKQTVAYFCSM